MQRDSAAQSGAEGRTEIESFMYGPGLQVTRLSGKLRVDDHRLDFRIWNHKVYRPRPLLVEEDGDVAGFRRWFRQFYSGEAAAG